MSNRSFIIRYLTAALLTIVGCAGAVASILYVTSGLSNDVRIAAISVGGIIASGLVTAAIALFGFWITFKTSTAANQEIVNATKEMKNLELEIAAASKQAEFRQAWINDLRQSVVDYLVIVTTIVDKSTNTVNPEDNKKMLLNIERIELMLNMDEEYSKTLIENIRELADKAIRPHPIDWPSVHAARGKVSDSARKILKVEWDKLRTELKTRK